MIIGIDPGKNGGIACYYESKFRAWPMPDTEDETANLIRSLVAQAGRNCTAFIEYVATSPQQGIKSAGTFMKNAGVLHGILAAYQVPRHEVKPLKWQSALSCLTGGNKSVSKRKALQLFPRMKITNKTADALLICYYGVQKARQ